MHTQVPQNRLAELRKEQNVTLREIGELTGVYTSTVKRWERDGGFIPQQHLGAIANHLGVSVAYLTGWSDTAKAAA